MTSQTATDTFGKITVLLEEAEQELHKTCGLLAQIGQEGDQKGRLLAKAKSQYGSIASNLKRARNQLDAVRRDADHWRGQFLLSQIDVVSEIDRAEKAEEKLNAAILPLPYDEQRLVEERDLSWLAFTDPITQLGNANKLDLHLKKAVENSFATGQLSILFIIDLDNFRTINEFTSWSEGDEVLEEIASRLVDNTPKESLLSRRCEDEFALVVSLEKGKMGESPLVQARQIADFLLKLLSQPLKLNNQPFPITASIGISACPDDADTPLEMLENAYSALMAAKARGGNRYVIYSDSVYKSREDRARQATELKDAINSNELLYNFRPVADVQKGHLIAAVVEPEWNHPAHGRLRQDEFMELAEEHGLMPTLVNQIIEAGCELSRKMKGSISVVLRLPQSVLNIHGFEKTLMDTITKARIKPDSIVLELPGSALIEAQSPLTRVFRELGRWGIKGSLGIQEATPILLGSLNTCCVGMLHLAPELLESVPAQESRRGVVQSYLDASNRLGVTLLVNGLADSSQGHFLALHDCDWAAGDYLSPSLDLNDFIKKRRSTWRFK